MTGLEPHPIFKLPTQEQARAMGPERFDLVRLERKKRMELEHSDPLKYGFEPEIWHVVDDLLVDGNQVVLDLTRLAKISPDGKTIPVEIDVPKEIEGRPEIWIAGSNRSSKTEYAVKKVMKALTERDEARTWSFADTGPISVARQQPLFWKYLPAEEKRMAVATGKARQGAGLKITYSKAGGFAGETFVLLNLSQHWFKNYAQDIENVEGDQLDAILLDELRDVKLLKTLRGRMGDRGGIIIASFTAIDDNYSGVVDEYDKGSRTVLEVDAELLPLKKDGQDTGRFEKVPRIKVAGPGSENDQRANIVYFHITDNPFYGFNAKPKPGSPAPIIYGKERFYKLYRNAVRSKILARVYGILTSGSRQKFPEFNEAIHVCTPDQVPRAGTNYHIVDPCDGRNWFMIWERIDARGRKYIYREWPSFSPQGYNNTSKSAYIPGIGDPGPWALPGTARGGNSKPPEDGDQGPAQQPFGFGLTRYKQEILRCEGHADRLEAASLEVKKPQAPKPLWNTKKNPLPNRLAMTEAAKTSIAPGVEIITDRYMDSRYGTTPTTTQEGQTTLVEQMEGMGMSFLAASGKNISEGIDLIHEGLDYDKDVPIGEWSPRLARINEPLLKISSDCPNLIFSLKNWTGRDGQRGAMKDPIDDLRYAELADLQYVGDDSLVWRGGGKGY